MTKLAVTTEEVDAAGQAVSRLSGPAGTAADDLQGRLVMAPGFQTAAAVTNATSAWSIALAGLVDACRTWGSALTSSAGEYVAAEHTNQAAAAQLRGGG